MDHILLQTGYNFLLQNNNFLALNNEISLPTTDVLLQENGDDILLENGDQILLDKIVNSTDILLLTTGDGLLQNDGTSFILLANTPPDYAQVNRKTFTVDGKIFAVTRLNFTVDAIVGVISNFGGLDGYYLNGTKLKRPKTFKRSFIYQKTDYNMITGKTTRDTSSRKEKYNLGYDNLTKEEVTALQAILAEDRAVQFIVNQGGIIGIDKVCFPYIGSLEYDTLGEDYLASLELELIEEQASTS